MPESISDASWLTSGPRGRRLLWSLLDPQQLGRPWFDLWGDGPTDVGALLSGLESAVADTLHRATPRGALADRLLAGLGAAADVAWYWQEPDCVDRALALDDIQQSLAPLASAVAAAAPAWWAAPVALADQRVVVWEDPHLPTITLTGADEKLAAWRADTEGDEQRAAERPRDVRAAYSGYWWSAPCLSSLPATTRRVPGLGAVGLAACEDAMGWDAARCCPTAPVGAPRIFEVAGSADWIELVGRYPLDVSLARRHDWWRATGVESPWAIPDYVAVRRDFDAVHLTTRAYLAAAGVALSCGSSSTLLAGWNADETYWLTDCLLPSGPPQRWIRGEDAVWVHDDA